MKSKKTRPILSKSSNPTPTKSRQKLLIAILLVLLLIVVGYLVWARTLPDTSASITNTPSATIPTEVSQSPSIPVQDKIDRGDNADNSAASNESIEGLEASDVKIPSSNTILNAPLPETDSLAKEEIDRLEDEQQRLAEQEKLAAEQVAMNKQLTDMKAEQIKLLEQQIAQLEADELAKNTAK
jgi:hypothetical protein